MELIYKIPSKTWRLLFLLVLFGPLLVLLFVPTIDTMFYKVVYPILILACLFCWLKTKDWEAHLAKIDDE